MNYDSMKQRDCLHFGNLV